MRLLDWTDIAEGALRSDPPFPSTRDYIHLSDLWNDEGDSINSQKKIELAKVNEDFIPPKRVYDPNYIECTAPDTPVEFYDNDDGYWDDYIKEKEARRATVPLPRSRPHYKH